MQIHIHISVQFYPVIKVQKIGEKIVLHTISIFLNKKSSLMNILSNLPDLAQKSNTDRI